MNNTKITFPFMSEIKGYPHLEKLIYQYNHIRDENIIFEIVDEIIKLIITQNGMRVILATKTPCVDGNEISWTPQYVTGKNDTKWIPVFTSKNESDNGPATDTIPTSITALFDLLINNDSRDGIVINPWGEGFMLNKRIIEYITTELKIKIPAI